MQKAALLAVLASLGACATTQTTKGGLAPYAAAGVSDAATAGRRYALVIGTDAYDDEKYPDLRYAAADARALAEKLAGFDDVMVLDTPEQTTQAGIRAAMEALGKKAVRSQDTVLVYLSGHGTLGREADGPLERFLVPTDADARAIEATGISVGELVEQLEATAAQKKGLVLAACYNGREKSALTEALASELASYKGDVPPLMQRSQAMIVTSAASWGEVAIEDKTLGHDVYTWFLLEGLERGDRDLDGAVTLTEAHDYARERTYAFTKGRQRPSARAVMLGRDPIVLAGDASGARPPLLYSYDDNADGLTVVLDGQTKGELPGGIPVEPGVHKVQLVGDGRVVHSEKVRLETGDRLSLAELVRDRARWSVRAGGALGTALGDGASVLRPTAVGPGLAVAWRAPSSRWNAQFGGVWQRRPASGVGPRWTAVGLDMSGGYDLFDHPVVGFGPVIGVQGSWSRWAYPFDFNSTSLGAMIGGGARTLVRPHRRLELGVDGRFGGSVIQDESGMVAFPAIHAALFLGVRN